MTGLNADWINDLPKVQSRSVGTGSLWF